MKKWFSIIIVLSSLIATAQLKPIGSWTEHMPHKTGTSVTTNGTIVYCGTRSGLFTFNTSDGSISRYTKVNKLNDINVKQVSYNSFNQSLVVVYENGNIDILKGNAVFNIPFIKNKIDLGDKLIYSISFYEEKAFLSFGFGIVELNTDKNEISDTYQFGANGIEIKVNSTVQLGTNIYGATDNGFFVANINTNLLDFNSWVKNAKFNNSKIKKLFVFNNKIYSVVNNITNNSDSIFDITDGTPLYLQNTATNGFKAAYSDKDELLIVTSNKIEILNKSLVKTSDINRSNSSVLGITKPNNNLLYITDNFSPLVEHNRTSDVQVIKPQGPFDKGVFDMEVRNGILWSVPGGIDRAYNSTFNLGKIYKLENGTWTNITYFNESSLSGSFDLSSVKINPNNENDVYFGSFGRGLFRFNESLPILSYNHTNSGLEERNDFVWEKWVGTVGIDFDENNNLWVTNSYNNRCLKARINGNWISFDFQNFISSSTAVTDLIITPSGHKWMVLPRDNAILVFNDNGTTNNTSDDKAIVLNSEVGNGSIPGIVGINIEIDKKGQIWVGTTDGIAIFFNPDQVFEAGSRDAQRVLIDGEENVEILLASTTILDIAVDGANRKWIATEEAGVYLLSEDGTEEIHHFTSENSPLLSNSVTAVAIDDKSGEVYFGTGNGIISFRGTATEGQENFSEVKIFPNPVRESYTGPISISGLVDNSTVKITDISGNLVNELRSIGGQAIWDGNTFGGKRAKTGVYLIFNSAEDAEQNLKTHVGKILFVN